MCPWRSVYFNDTFMCADFLCSPVTCRNRTGEVLFYCVKRHNQITYDLGQVALTEWKSLLRLWRLVEETSVYDPPSDPSPDWDFTECVWHWWVIKTFLNEKKDLYLYSCETSDYLTLRTFFPLPSPPSGPFFPDSLSSIVVYWTLPWSIYGLPSWSFGCVFYVRFL